jgi:hypothetical protein
VSEKTVKLNAAKWIADQTDRPLMYTLSFYGLDGWKSSPVRIRKFHDGWLLYVARDKIVRFTYCQKIDVVDAEVFLTLNEAKLAGEIRMEPWIREQIMRTALT